LISIFITKIQGQGKVIGILTMQFGEVTITSSVLFQRGSLTKTKFYKS